jgi:hypothetical protein
MTNHPEAALRALAEHGLRCDMNPTHDMSSLDASEEFWHRYLRMLDANVRQLATNALEAARERPKSCPHSTSPLRYCDPCPVSPCPMEVEAAPSPPDSSPKECCGNYNYNGDCCGRYVTTTNSPAIDTSLVVGPADSSQGGPIQNLCGWEFDDAAGVHHVTNSLELPSYAQSNIKPRYTHPSSPQVAVAEFQSRVRDWTHSCFGAAIANDKTERNHRFLEESLEQVQSLGCTQSEAHQLVDYVYGRPSGDPMQEAGGVMVTFAALCNANDISMREVGEAELARIWTKLETIRAKQAAKPKHSPLPQADDEPLFTASMYGTAAAADKAREEWLAAKGVDAARLDFVASEYLHLVPFDMPTGQGDADVGWEIRQSVCGQIKDVVIVRHYKDDVRAALDEAICVIEKIPDASADMRKARSREAAQSMFDDLYETADHEQRARSLAQAEQAAKEST